ncbi:hypothetical protein F2Q68_00011240 [Brassica cretica]|uniref:Uncharacterized protein n=1 Tax=Brassica cretica TaxID=69181 RepID=A0A8S9KWC3_BRACR|nr:hypothetical protein F2Q68_00011240 [Brassica cretica]
MRTSIFVDDQSSPEYAIEYANPCYPNNGFRLQTQVNPCLWTNLGPKSHETTSTHSLQAQGRRSTIALPERTEAHRECRPGAKSKNIAPYTRGDEAHKPPCFRRINSRTSGPQEDISVIDEFREDTSNMTKWRDLTSAKSTRNCRTTRPTKVLLPRSYPIDLKGPTGSEHEALKSLRFQRRITGDYEFLHDVHRYFGVVRQRFGLHASTKGLIPPE